MHESQCKSMKYSKYMKIKGNITPPKMTKCAMMSSNKSKLNENLDNRFKGMNVSGVLKVQSVKVNSWTNSKRKQKRSWIKYINRKYLKYWK